MNRRLLYPGLALLAALLLLFFAGSGNPEKKEVPSWKRPNPSPALLENEPATSRAKQAVPPPPQHSPSPAARPNTGRIPLRDLWVRVVDKKGHGIEGAAVRAGPKFARRPDPGIRSGITGPDGRWKTSFPMLLPLEIGVSAPGYWPSRLDGDVSEADAQEILVVLAPRVDSAFTLKVVDQTRDTPLAGARIFTETEPPEPVGITGADGRLAVAHHPAGETLMAHAEAHFPHPVYLPAGPLGREVEFLVKLAPLAPIEVVFQDAVDFTPLHPLVARFLAGGRELPASFEDGVWVVPPDPLLAWETRIAVESEGYLPASFRFKPGRNAVDLQPAASLIVRVQGDASGMRVETRPSGVPRSIPLHPGIAGPDWLADLSKVPAGDLGLFLLRGDEVLLAREVPALQPGEKREVRIALAAGMRWTIRVADETGRAVPAALVRLLGDDLVDEGITDEEGRVVLRTGRPSFLGVRAAGFLPRLVLDPPLSPSRTLLVKLERGITIHGRITGPQSQDGTWNWAGWRVSWDIPSGESESWTALKTVQNLPPGSSYLARPFASPAWSFLFYPVKNDGSFAIDDMPDRNLEIHAYPPRGRGIAAKGIRKAGSKEEVVLKVSKLRTILFFDRPLEKGNQLWMAGVVGKKGEHAHAFNSTRSDSLEKDLPLGRSFVDVQAEGYQETWLEIWREPGFNDLVRFSLEPLVPKNGKMPEETHMIRFLKTVEKMEKARGG